MLRLMRNYLKQYTVYALLAPLTVVLEVILEIFIPYMMTKIVDIGIANGDMGYIAKIGVFMIFLALFSLIFGALSGRFAAKAATGFARNIREAMFHKISDYSFNNIDRFSTASLVTRLTTDITNTQNSFMMIIRVMFRAPVMMIGATIMATSINKELSMIFMIAIPVIAVVLVFLITKAFPLFQKMLGKYDGLNASVQEDLIAMRVVKAFVREDYEKGKFADSSEMLRAAQVKAEKMIIFNMPLMMFAIYACMIGVAWFGGNFIIAGKIEAGEFMVFFNYINQILMSLMMLSM
ncbi:MAG: ABC transporter ATP-binding protein, partial [Christensenellaceae bacterium]|nr:ABC transporter ATP-binding protein [Christensenellaceae bacterium]